MPKNISGGNKAKKFASKNFKPQTNAFVRVPKLAEEILCVVTKFYGNTFDATDSKGTVYRTALRGKFRGRNKRSSLIAPGVLVLVGTRDFGTDVDLLEVYQSSEIAELISHPTTSEQMVILRRLMETLMGDGDGGGVVGGDNGLEVEFTEEEPLAVGAVTTEANTILFDDEVIDINDI